MKGLSTDLTGLEDELDTMKPPARDIKTVRIQQDDVAKLINKVSRNISALFLLFGLLIQPDSKEYTTGNHVSHIVEKDLLSVKKKSEIIYVYYINYYN